MFSLLQILPRAFFRVFAWLAFALIVVSAHAHKASDSYLNLRVEGSTVTGHWDIALRDIEQVIPLDTDGDGNISWGEVRSLQPEIVEYVTSRLQAKTGDVVLKMQVTELLIEEFTDGAYAVLRFALEGADEPGGPHRSLVASRGHELTWGRACGDSSPDPGPSFRRRRTPGPSPQTRRPVGPDHRVTHSKVRRPIYPGSVTL